MSRLRPVIGSPHTRLGYGESMVRLLRMALGALGFLAYAWFRGVRNAPRVKRAKALRRRARAPE